MKKSILMLLLPLLALASWAQPSGVTTSPMLASTIEYDGYDHQLISTPAVVASDYNMSYTGEERNRGGRWYWDDPAGIQYYVQGPSEAAPVNGNVGDGVYTYIQPAWSLGEYGITKDAGAVKASAIGAYHIWYRVMRDHNNGPGYSTSNWVDAGVVSIVEPTTATSKPYLTSGPVRVSGLIFNDEEQELITVDNLQPCAGYDIAAAGGLLYVVKETEGMPTAAEIAAATTTIPKGLDAGTYYVYYMCPKDNVNFHEDGYWTEVGVGGISIGKREITEADFEVTFKNDLIYNDADQDLLDPAAFVWTNGIDRTASTPTVTPLGKIQYIVDDELDADGNSTGTPVDMPQGKNAGEYNIRVVITGDGNHKNYMSAIDYGTAIIAKATLTISQEPAGYDNLVYNGAEQQLLKQGVKVKFNGADFATSRFYAKYTMNGEDYTGAEAYKKPKGTDADEDEDNYVITWEVTPVDADNFNTPVGSGSVNVDIAKADWVLNTPEKADDWAYDGLEHSLLKTPLTATGKVTTDVADIKYYINDGAAIAEADVKAKDVDEYEVFYEIEATTNYNAVPKTSIGTVKVTKVKLHMGAQGIHVAYTGTEIDYHELIKLDMDEVPAGEPLKSDPDALKDALVKFTYFAEPGEIVDGKPTVLPTDAGAYDFTLAPIEGNYELVDFIPNGTLTIDKIDATPATVTAATLTYNGTDQELVTIPDPSDVDGGTMLYYLGETAPVVPEPVDEFGEWSEDIPTGLNAGEYKVWYVVKGDKNHNSGTPASIDVTIAKKDLADDMFALASDKEEFTGENLMPEFTFADGDPSILAEADFKVAKTNSDGDDVTEMVNVDTYTFTFDADAVADGNYQGVIYKTFEITPKPIDADDVEFALEVETVEYDGANHAEDVKVIPTAPLTEADYSVGYPAEMINAGEYTITLTATSTGNYSGTTTATFTITKKALADDMFTLAPEDLVFDGTDQKVTLAAVDGEPNILAETDFELTKIEYNGEEVTELINAGEYTFTYEATATGNYEGTATATISIAKATAEVVEPTLNKMTYNNTDQSPVTEGTTDAVAGAFDEPAGKVEYQIVDAEGETVVDWTDDYAAVVVKDAGAYTVNYRITASEVNYTNPLIEGSIDVEILKAEISYMLGNITKPWDGKAFTEEEINSLFAINQGELFGDDKYDRPFNFTLKEDYRDAGDYDFSTAYEVVYKEGYAQNYDVKVGGTGNIKINKVDIDATYITAPEAIADLTYINGKAQELVTAGKLADEAANAEDYPNTEIAGKPFGTIVFSDAEDGEYTAEIPTGTDAGDYEIWWKVAGDINHNDTKAQKIENSIAANASGFQLAFEDNTWTYDGVEFYPEDVNAYDGEVATVAGADYDFTLTKDGEAFEGKLVDAGTYVFTYTGKGNYEGSSAEATIVIEPKELEDAMVKLTAEKAEYNTADQKPEYTLTYTPEGKPALTLAEDKDFTVEADAEMVTGGEYEFTFTGIGNYTGTATATFTITKRKVIAQAENCEKDYDGYYGLAIDGGTVEVPITWGGLVEGEAEENIPVAGEGAITVDPLKKDVGKYAIIVDGSKFESDNYEVIKGDREAWLTINPIDLKVKWAGKASKIYGSADPALASYLVIEGAVGAEVEDIRANTVITRAKGETVGTYGVELSAKAGAKVFGNYNVTFEGADEAFEIKKAHLIASLAPQTVTYTGVKADLGEIPSDQLVVNGLLHVESLGINDYKDVVSNIVVNIPDDAINVGDYEITLASADAANYEFEFLPATLTIEPLDISEAVVTIPEQQVRVGDVAADVIDAENFTIECEGFYAPDADAFKVAAADRFVDADGKIKKADNHETGLVLVPVDPADDIVYNYTGWEADAFTGNLVVVGGETILLDDTKDIATTAKTGVDVTFTSRNILQDNWNVLCLPFDVTIKQVSDAFGYAAVDLLNPAPTDGNMHFVITSTGVIEAGTPFIVKPTSDPELGAKSNFNQITFYGVDVKAFSANPEPVKDNSGNKFCGTFMAETTFYGDAFWYMSKGMWKQASNYTEAKPVKLGAYRGYIELASAGARIFVEEPDGTITGIDGLQLNNNEANAEGWYTVNGMKLDAAPTQKGTYINNGKKVIVK